MKDPCSYLPHGPAEFFYDLHGTDQGSSECHLAVFLDRDGVLIEEKNYLKDPKDVEIIEGSVRALGLLNSLGVFVAVVSNQAGVARGLLTLEDVKKVNNEVLRQLNKNKVYINSMMFCPYYPEGNIPEFCIESDLRKPNTGMFEFIKNYYRLDPSNTKFFMVWDKYSDILFGKKIGAEVFLVGTGYG